MDGTKMRASSLALLLLIAVLACDSGEKAPKVSLAQSSADSVHKAAGVQVGAPTLGPEAKAALDSGNALFRRKAYAPALAQYRLAASLAPKHAAPYFGISMVAQATGNKALGDSALAAIRERGAEPAVMPHTDADSVHRKTAAAVKKAAIS